MTYHNTTHSLGSELRGYERQALCQEGLILEYFLSHEGGYTPSDIQKAVLPNAPVTSVRRAFTNLTDAGLLRKTSRQTKGPYGRPEYIWEHEPKQRRLF